MVNTREHKFIGWRLKHFKSLGIVRSHGEEDIKPCVITVKDDSVPIMFASKHIEKKYFGLF